MSNTTKIKKLRSHKRSAFTKALNVFDERSIAPFSKIDQNAAFDVLKLKFDELTKTSEQYIELLHDDDAIQDDDIAKEMEDGDVYIYKFFEAKGKLQSNAQITEARSETPLSVVSNSSQQDQQSIKLPKIELVKFSGDIKEWLKFWSLFKKIHVNPALGKEDKFQYLTQAMVPNSQAAELVNSYPPTAENYDKVIECLKSRFGDKDLQTELYMRELLKLLSLNLINKGKGQPLCTLYDKIISHIRSLDSLGLTTDNFAAVLCPLVESCLPEELIQVWQRNYSIQVGNDSSIGSNSKDRFKLLLNFLQNEVKNDMRNSLVKDRLGLEQSENLNEKSNKPKKVKNDNSAQNIPSATNLLATKEHKRACLFCDSTDHESETCSKPLTLAKRQEILKGKRACFSCLRIGHSFWQCRNTKLKCEKCARRHVTFMCPFDEKKNENSLQALNSTSVDNDINCFSSTVNNTPVYLQTVKAKLINNGKEMTVRVLFDSGSQHSYIKGSTASSMGYQPIGELQMNHLLFGGARKESVKHVKYAAQMSSLNNNYKCDFIAIDSDIICENVPAVRKGLWCKELQNLNIKFTDFDGESSITVLIGSDISGKLETGRIHQLQCGLTAKETLLGWTLSGRCITDKDTDNAAIAAISMFTQGNNIEDLWSLDVLGIKDPIMKLKQETHDENVKSNFLKSVSVNEQGRYEVPLPWIETHRPLGTNKPVAHQRLLSTIKKLRSDGYYARYEAVLDDWQKLGIIERVPEEEKEKWGHYLPHRAVVKEQSTTAVRPVFDASSHEAGRPSLNECLHKGPNLIELVSTVLLRFREGKIGIISDIEKAFLQISIDPKHRDFLRFLWQDAQNKDIVFRHCRVVFGVCSSPFILGAVIELHLKNAFSMVKDEKTKEYCKKLLNSLYVDNCVTSVNCKNELNEFMCEAKSLMSTAKFNLRGWEYNGDESNNLQTGVLGIIWNKHDDTLSLNAENLKNIDLNDLTKRKILSVTHRIFDPIGFASPITIVSRTLLQQTWNEKLTWDQIVDKDIETKFLKWFDELRYLKEIKIPRCFLGNLNDINDVSLHTFCDASQHSYATVIFLRVQRGSSVDINFVQAKSRVAPAKSKTGKHLQKHSIPRLELLAASIGTRLTSSILSEFKIENLQTYYWTDSSTVLAWIKRDRSWATFVYNRVNEIRKLTEPNKWFHVPGFLNPADLPSRGCSVKHLLASKWYEGPVWLKEPREAWPSQEQVFDEQEINKEIRKAAPKTGPPTIPIITMLACDTNNKTTLFEKFSSYNKILLVVGWLKRFYNNSKLNAKKTNSEFLLASEIRSAETTVIKCIQSKVFTDLNDKAISFLKPKKDDDGIIRLKSKLLYRDDTYNFKNPVLLPRNNDIVHLIIKERHEQLNHARVNIVMNSLREDFWILGGRKEVRTVLNKCINCQRHSAKHLNAEPAPLPNNRVRDAAVFEVIGVDFAGPLIVKDLKKTWVCIFTCAVFRAVHFELVNSLDTPSFLMALRRFIARRGRPSVVYSDHGTNFVGLNNCLNKVDFKKLAKIMALEKIEWILNPPAAPWWGGFFESLIGLLKRLLRRTLKKTCLSHEEMLTVLIDCEAIVNSRPITFLADNCNEIAPLSPSHFLHEIKEIGVLDLDNIENCDLNRRYVHRIKIKEDLRKRFREEYLGSLSYQKNKSSCINKPLKIGDIVLIGSDNKKRLDWPLARVNELISGKDGCVRVVRLKTADGELVRPIQRIYPLELSNNETLPIITVQKEMINKRKQQKNKECKKACVADVTKKSVVNEKPVTTRSGRVVKKIERLTYNKK